MGNRPFPWRWNTFEQEPSWGKEPVSLLLLLCEGDAKHLHTGPRDSADTVSKEKYKGQQQRGFGMRRFVRVFRRKAGSYCFWWVLNCSMDCSMALNGPYREAALGSIRSRIRAFLFVFLIPTQAFRAQAVTLNKTTDCKCHSLLIYLLSLSLPKMWKWCFQRCWNSCACWESWLLSWMILHIQGMIHSLLRGRKDCTSCTTSPSLIDGVVMFPQGSLVPPG